MSLNKEYPNPEDDPRVPPPQYYDSRSKGDVEQHLTEIAALRDEWVEAEEHANAQIEKATAWLDAEKERIGEDIKWRQASAMAWFRRDENNLGKASRKLINGTLKKTTGQLRVVVFDEESIPRNLCTHKPEQWTPNKNMIKSYIKETGEIPIGAETEYGEDEYYVDTGHGKDYRGVSVQYTELSNDPDTDYELDETEGKPLHEWNGG